METQYFQRKYGSRSKFSNFLKHFSWTGKYAESWFRMYSCACCCRKSKWESNPSVLSYSRGSNFALRSCEARSAKLNADFRNFAFKRSRMEEPTNHFAFRLNCEAAKREVERRVSDPLGDAILKNLTAVVHNMSPSRRHPKNVIIAFAFYKQLFVQLYLRSLRGDLWVT